jgi:hypothetical protein
MYKSGLKKCCKFRFHKLRSTCKEELNMYLDSLFIVIAFNYLNVYLIYVFDGFNEYTRTIATYARAMCSCFNFVYN